MKVSVRIDSTLLADARAEAARRGVTLSALIAEGLTAALARAQPGTRRDHLVLPECRAGGGVLPGVNLDDYCALLDRLEGRG